MSGLPVKSIDEQRFFWTRRLLALNHFRAYYVINRLFLARGVIP